MIKQKELKASQEELGQQELSNKELVEKLLFKEYSDLKDVFLKAALDILALHQKYNLKIKLEKDTDLGFSPLCHLSLEELQTCKQYLVNNLNKGFIEPSQALFAALILFARKANRSL